MGSLIKKRPSPALVVAMLALFVSLSASAVGLSGKNKIDSNDLKKNVVALKNMKNSSVKGAEVVESTLAAVPNANALGGSSLAEVNPAGFVDDTTCANLGNSLATCTTLSITLDRTMDVYLNAAAQWNSDDASGSSVGGDCDILRTGAGNSDDAQFGTNDDDTADTQERSVSFNALFSDVPAGTNTFEYRCEANAGDDIDMSQIHVIALGVVSS